MKDDVRSYLLRPELAHVFQKKETECGADLEQMRISPEDLQNGPTDSVI